MKNLEVGTKVDFYEVVSYKNGVYVLLAKRYYNNYYGIINQLQNIV